MATFCARCNRELGWFSKKQLTLPDGSTVAVCKACAARPPEVPSPIAEASPREVPPREAPYRDDDLAALEAEFRSNPGSLDVLYRLGRLSLQRAETASGKEREQHLERAAKVFRALLLQTLDASAPCSKASVFYFLGVVSHRQGSSEKAIQMLERAQELEPGLVEARSLLERLRAQQSRP